VARWPLHPPPLDDECLSSWIVRLAAAYHMDVTTFCQDALALHASHLRTLDRQPPPALLTRLAHATTCAPARVIATTLRRYEGLLFPTLDHPTPDAVLATMQRIGPDLSFAYQWTRERKEWTREGATPWLFPHARASTMQFCALCLAEGPMAYPRTHWRLALSTACSRHHVELRDTCHHCGWPAGLLFPPIRPQLSCHCLCGVELSQAPTVCAPIAVAALAKYTHEAVTAGTVTLGGTTSLGATTYFEVLRAFVEALRLTRARQPWAEACWRTLDVEPGDARPHLAVPFEAQSLRWRVHTMQLVGELLTEWPHRFLASCHRVSLKAIPLLRRMQGLPVALFGPLAAVLTAQNPPLLTRFLLTTHREGLQCWQDPRIWATAYLTACRRIGLSTQAIRSRSRALPAPLWTVLDDLLFEERVERAVTRAVERAKVRW
jgi:hypothetical protein